MNKLQFESSPYLLQHQHNPVHWLPWGSEALLKATVENKPIILSIGYSACHWCHVMEHECFEDEQVAALMNNHYVCIKVDREERPDIDSIYMDAVQNMGVRGGWPLNVFLTPLQLPFYGGTYFPKNQWMQVLDGIHHAFLNQHDEITKTAEGIRDALTQNQNFGHLKFEELFDFSEVEAAAQNIIPYFDTLHGGLERSPKFPMPCIWDFLIAYNAHNSHKVIHKQLTLTMNRIVLGGIFDHVAGGWTRYSTDERWKVPHFEKMLYDNGQLLSIYAKYLSLNGPEPLYLWAINQTLDWLHNEMLDPSGGFYAALDADSENQEGKYYVWGKAEIEQILGTNSEAFCSKYEITEAGNWEHGNNILHLEDTFDLDVSFRQSLGKLKENRKNRIRPGLDNKLICSWNAILLNGLIDCAKVDPRDSTLEMVQHHLIFFEKHLSVESVNEDGDKAIGLYHLASSKVLLGFLDDYAFLIKAYLNYYTFSFDETYLLKASDLLKYTLANFYDANDQLFFFNDIQAEQLISRKKEVFDNVIPSCNAVMAHNLFQLGRLLYDDEWIHLAELMYRKFATQVRTEAQWLCEWAHLGLKMSIRRVDIIVTGDAYKSLLKELGKIYPSAILIGANKSSSLRAFKGKKFEKESMIYVCYDHTCASPVSTLADASKLLSEIEL